jgi:beta-N-acetylhexosaminidase
VEKRSVFYVDPVEEYVDARLSVMTLDEKIASLFMLHAPGTDGAALGSFAAAQRAGGLILMGDNIPEPESALATMTPALAAEAGLPILVAIDQEGGVVRRLYGDEWDAA